MCVCASDNQSPDVADYEQTLPGLMCREYKDQCVAAAPNNLDLQTACLATNCGNKTVDDATSSISSSASASATSSSSRTASGSETSETASSTSGGDSASSTASQSASATAGSSAASGLNIASSYGTGLLAVGILAAFGLAL
jgi:cobalamin biosynthesis Mg chelatase CobN